MEPGTTSRVLELLQAHGYPVLGAVVLAEHTFLVGLAVPGDIAVLAAGALASRGVLTPLGALASIVGGATAGLAVSYVAGIRVGLPVVEKWGARWGVDRARFEGLATWFGRNGTKAVFLASFVAGVKNLVPAVAGATRFPAVRFFAAGVLGCTLRAVGFGAIGWAFGANLDRGLALLHQADRGALALFAAMVAALLVARALRKRSP